MDHAIHETYAVDGEKIETVTVQKRYFERLQFERKALIGISVVLALMLVVTSGVMAWTRSDPQILILPSSSVK